MTKSDKRVWEIFERTVANNVSLSKIACYQAVWSHPLNGDGVQSETGIKYDYSLNFDTNDMIALDSETAKSIFIEKVRNSAKPLLKSNGTYLLHMRIKTTNNLIVGERLSYTPFYIVQALVHVNSQPVSISA